MRRRYSYYVHPNFLNRAILGPAGNQIGGAAHVGYFKCWSKKSAIMSTISSKVIEASVPVR